MVPAAVCRAKSTVTSVSGDDHDGNEVLSLNNFAQRGSVMQWMGELDINRRTVEP
jgi:hypothetical protein